MEQKLTPSNKSTVVIIDKDEAMRHSLEWLIESSGYTVLGYESGLRYLDGAVGATKQDAVNAVMLTPAGTGDCSMVLSSSTNLRTPPRGRSIAAP